MASEQSTAQSVTTAGAAASAANKENDRGYESLHNQPSTDPHQYERVHPSSAAEDGNRAYLSLQDAPSTVSGQYEMIFSTASRANIKLPQPAVYEELALAT